MRQLLAVVASLALFLGGCSVSQAQKAQNVIAAVINVAVAEVPAVPVADQTAYKSWLSLAQTLDRQLVSCLSSISSMSLTKSGKIVACFNTFASGLNSPTELAQLRLMSASSQSKAQLYITAIIVGVNTVEAAFGGSQVATPAVTTPPTAAELEQLKSQPLVAEALGR